MRRALAGLLAALAALAVAPAGAAAYRFGPGVRQSEPEQTVLDWSTQRCDFDDYPDGPVRAFRDAGGQTQLIVPAPANRRMRGPSLDLLGRDCDVVLASRGDPDPAAFANREWLTATWTDDGRTIEALVHNEHHGDQGSIGCLWLWSGRCWYNAITAARSTDGGATYVPAPAPRRLVASPPYRYVAGNGPYGVFEPSNVLRARRPGERLTFRYVLVHVEAQPKRSPVQHAGACLMRARNLADPASWRAWGGRAFDVRFADPYAAAPDPAAHACAPIAYPEIEKMNSSLTYNWHLRRYLLVGMSGQYDPARLAVVNGFYYATSRDLVHWSARRLLMEAPLPWTCPTGLEQQVAYPSLLDPASPGRNYDRTGRRPYLYFTRLNDRCLLPAGADRDLVRIPIELNP